MAVDANECSGDSCATPLLLPSALLYVLYKRETSIRLGGVGLMRQNQMWMREKKNANGNRRAEVVKCVGKAERRVINTPVVSVRYVLTDTF